MTGPSCKGCSEFESAIMESTNALWLISEFRLGVRVGLVSVFEG